MMSSTFRRYHIATKNAPLSAKPVPRVLIERSTACVNCGICIEACLYKAHERQPKGADYTRMAEPLHENCVVCQRCVNECPRDALSLRSNPEFERLGDSAYSPDAIETLLYEAETGRVPVSGQGYRGPFSGPGFDRIWTDMSEIVRPTRDGIHGRETISTEIELGRKPDRLEFGPGGELKTPMPPSMRLAFPVFFSPPPFKAPEALWPILHRAALETGTFLLLDQQDCKPDFATRACVPRLTTGRTPSPHALKKNEMVEIPYSSKVASEVERLKMFNERLVVSIQFPFDSDAEKRALELSRAGAEVLHLLFTEQGMSFEQTPRPLVDALRSLDDRLVAEGARDPLTILVSGGITRAEHVPKALLCGADAVGIRLPAAIALGLRRFDTAVGRYELSDLALNDTEVCVQRLKNLLSSWRDQLLEVLGAMGIREARRLQGESGRAMFYEDLEAEFEALFEPCPRGFEADRG